ELPGRHPTLLLRALRDCQAAGLIEPGPPAALMMFLAAAIALPPVFAAGLIGGELLPAAADKALRRTLDETGSLPRLGWARKGIAGAPAPKRARRVSAA